MDPGSQISIRALQQALRALGWTPLDIFPTETLSALLRLLLQTAERVSDELDERGRIERGL